MESVKNEGSKFSVHIPEAVPDAESFSADGSDYIFDGEDEIF